MSKVRGPGRVVDPCDAPSGVEIRRHLTRIRGLWNNYCDSIDPLTRKWLYLCILKECVNITFFIKDKISGNLYYDLAMNAINRMTLGMAKELKDFNVSTVAVCPGWMRTERVTDAGLGPEDGTTETTAYVGRAVVALASDTMVSNISGDAITVAEPARKYGFTDVDGTQPLPFEG